MKRAIGFYEDLLGQKVTEKMTYIVFLTLMVLGIVFLTLMVLGMDYLLMRK